MSDTSDRLGRRLSSLSRTRSDYGGKGDAPRMRQRRDGERVPVFRFARIINASGEERACVLKDLSAAGARIGVDGALNLPEEIVLSIDQSVRRFHARVAWRRETEAGLFFKAELARDADPAAVLRPKPPRPRRRPVEGADGDDIGRYG
jgi:hypothetical protein